MEKKEPTPDQIAQARIEAQMGALVVQNVSLGVRVEALEAENAALKAQLAAMAPQMAPLH